MDKDSQGHRGSDPLASIVISNYNYARFVGDAIDSALRQSYRNLEIIVVDDGSTDESRDVIARFAPDITPIFAEHRGQCASLNRGFEASSGEVVLFLDADDCLLEDGLAELMRLYRAGDDGVAQYQGYLEIVDENLRPLNRRIPQRLSPSGSYLERTLERGLGVCRQTYTSGSLWPRWFLDEVFPLPEISEMRAGGYLGPDGYLNNAARVAGRIASVHRPVARYRVHGANCWYAAASLDAEALKAYLAAIDVYQEYLHQWCRLRGHTPDLARWRRWKRSWPDNLALLSLSFLDSSQQRPAFSDVVFAPFMAGTTGRLRALFMVPLLAFIWSAPRSIALLLATWALQRNLPSLAGRSA